MPVDMRSRYDHETRMRALEMFQGGRGYKSVSKRLGIPEDTVRKWWQKYQSLGPSGVLSVGGTQKSYPYELKLAAARAVVDEGKTEVEAMRLYGIASVSPLERWCRAYRAGGPEALRPRPKGRPKGSRSKPRKPTREQELERRIERLEAENAYLKKSIALKAGKRSRAARRPLP